jgi:hypothetical protein
VRVTMRVSDRERQRTIDELRRHCAAGRLDVDEYSSRLEKALAAATLEELDHLTADLPMVRIADPAGYRPGDGSTSGSALLAVTAGDRDRNRLRSAVVSVLTVMVVIAAVLFAIVVGWAWALVLLAGWLVGVVQGRVSHRRR